MTTTDALSVGAVRAVLDELALGASQEPWLTADELFAIDREMHDMRAGALGACATEAFAEARRAATTRDELIAALSVPVTSTEDIVGDVADACAFLARFSRRASRVPPAALADLLGFFVAAIKTGDTSGINAWTDRAIGAPRIAARGGARKRPRGKDMSMGAPAPDTTVFLGNEATQRRLRSGDAFMVVDPVAGSVRTLGGASDAPLDGHAGSVLVCVRTGERFRVAAGTGAPVHRRGVGAKGLVARAKRHPVAAVLSVVVFAMVTAWLVAHFTGTGSVVPAGLGQGAAGAWGYVRDNTGPALRKLGGGVLGAMDYANAGIRTAGTAGVAAMRALAGFAEKFAGQSKTLATWLMRATANGVLGGVWWAGKRFADVARSSGALLKVVSGMVGMPLSAIAATVLGQLCAETVLRAPWVSKANTLGRFVMVFAAAKQAHTFVVGALAAAAAVALAPAVWVAPLVGVLGAAATGLIAFWLQRKMAPGIVLEEGHFVAEGINADPQATLLNRAAIDMTSGLVGERLVGASAEAAFRLAHTMGGCCLMLDRALDTGFIQQVGTTVPRERGPAGVAKRKRRARPAA